MAERTCVVTRTVLPPDDMIRFVAGPDDRVVPDMKRNLPGRGVWVTAQKGLVEEAVRKNLFSRGLKISVKQDENLPDLVDGLLEQQALGALGFAKKAGECLTGAGKVEESIRRGKALFALHAVDGSSDGLRKLSQAAFAVARDGGPKIEIWRVFTAEQMSLALGATNVIHAGLTKGGAAQNCLHHVARLAHYRETEPS